MLSDQGFEMDLHRRIMTEYGGRVDQTQLWKSSLLVERRGVPVRILGPEDQIMHTCAHGREMERAAPYPLDSRPHGRPGERAQRRGLGT